LASRILEDTNLFPWSWPQKFRALTSRVKVKLGLGLEGPGLGLVLWILALTTTL